MFQCLSQLVSKVSVHLGKVIHLKGENVKKILFCCITYFTNIFEAEKRVCSLIKGVFWLCVDCGNSLRSLTNIGPLCLDLLRPPWPP